IIAQQAPRSFPRLFYWLGTSTIPSGGQDMITSSEAVREEVRYESWKHWPINWSAVWVGTLAALAVALLVGLIGIALGAHVVGPEGRVAELKKTEIGTLIFSVVGAFFAYVVGGWVAGK